MSAWPEWARALGAFVMRLADADRLDLDAELQFHVDMIETQLRERGNERDDAWREARLRVGGPAQIADLAASAQRSDSGDLRAGRFGTRSGRLRMLAASRRKRASGFSARSSSWLPASGNSGARSWRRACSGCPGGTRRRWGS
jgi:hypothetical protein